MCLPVRGYGCGSVVGLTSGGVLGFNERLSLCVDVP